MGRQLKKKNCVFQSIQFSIRWKDSKNRTYQCCPSCPRVVDYHAILDKQATLIKANRLLVCRPLITIEFDYPLDFSHPVRFTFCRPTGFTRKDIMACIYKGYAKIYADTRKYGVWGHSIGDLFIEGFSRKSIGLYELHMGS